MAQDCERFFGTLVKDIIDGMTPEGTTIEIDPNVPGLANLIKATTKAVARTVAWFYVKVYEILQDMKKAAQWAAELPKKLKDLLKEAVTEIVNSITADIKLPDFRTTLPDDLRNLVGSIEMPAIIKASIKMLMKIIKGIQSLPEAIADGVKDIIDGLGFNKLIAKTRDSEAVKRIQEIAKTVAEWANGLIKFILFLISLPGLIVKAIFDFITKKFTELVTGITKLTTTIIDSITAELNKQLEKLDLSVQIPGFTDPPIVKLVKSLLKGVQKLIQKILGAIADARDLILCTMSAASDIVAGAVNAAAEAIPDVSVTATSTPP